VALENSRLFEQERKSAEVFETAAEIGREVAAILDLDELLTSIAQLIKRRHRLSHLRDHAGRRSDADAGVQAAVQYGEMAQQKRIKLGEGLVGYARSTRSRCSVSDVSQDPRYLKVIEDVRSELVIPLMLKDRCIACSISPARSWTRSTSGTWRYSRCSRTCRHRAGERAPLRDRRANEERLEKEVASRSVCRRRWMPAGCRSGCAASMSGPLRARARAGRHLHDFLAPERTRSSSRWAMCPARACRRALQRVRRRTGARPARSPPYTTVRTTPAAFCCR